MAVEIRLANEVSWRELPAAWNAKRVMSLEEQEWVHLGDELWCRASAVVAVREILSDTREPADE
jgi:hypothetical protein